MNVKRMLQRLPPVWVIVMLAGVVWMAGYVRRGLWEPDEARYAYVAQEMHADSHWFVPHINGQPYPDKPPLLFWLINASSSLTGGDINSVSARLPSLLGAVLALWAATRLLGMWHAARSAWLVLMILPTSFLFWQEGAWGRIDALLCGLVMMSMYFFFTSKDGSQTRREVYAYLFAGLAMLAKGPVGLMVPLGAYAAASLASGDRSNLRRSHWLWGPLLALAIPLTWLLAAWMQHPPSEYFASMFGEKSFGRAVQSTGHSQPFHYFLWHFPMEFLPWSIFLPAAVVSLKGTAVQKRLAGWIVFVIAVFSLFVCKRNVYILAAFPAGAMMVAAGWHNMAGLSRRWKKVTAGAAAALLWVLAAAAIASLVMPDLPVARIYILPTISVLLAGALAITFLTQSEPLSYKWFVVFAGSFLLFQLSASAIVLPALNGIKGPITAAHNADEQLKEGQPVYLYGQQLAIFPLYAHHPGREVCSVDALKAVVQEDSEALVIFYENQWKEVGPEVDAMVDRVQAFDIGHKHLVMVHLTRPPLHEVALVMAGS